MGEIKFVGSLIIFAVFAISLTMFATQFAADNNAAFELGDEPGWDDAASQGRGGLAQLQVETESSANSFIKSEIQEGETVRTGGQFKVGPYSALATTTNLTKQGFNSVFGEDNQFAWIFNTLAAFLLFVIGLLIWKTWKGGNPE